MALLLAGHVTTTALLANAVLCLDENPAVLAAVRADRDLVPRAIEEVLRLRPPFSRLARRTTRDVELGGTIVPAGQIVALWLVSANRDEDVFAEPDRLDLYRDPNRHLAFGHGIHFCIGAPLARLETRIALNQLMDRYPGMVVARDEPVEFHDPKNLVGARRLPLDVARPEEAHR
jgi:cytochrome P450